VRRTGESVALRAGGVVEGTWNAATELGTDAADATQDWVADKCEELDCTRVLQTPDIDVPDLGVPGLSVASRNQTDGQHVLVRLIWPTDAEMAYALELGNGATLTPTAAYPWAEYHECRTESGTVGQ
jgi:hypothetical protein